MTQENTYTDWYMNRNLYHKLLKWKTSHNRKPLILRGARQVGKTHLLKLFGKQEYASCTYLNFEEDPKLNDFFTEHLSPSAILERLSIYLDQPLQAENRLLIFDEIQESPAALNSLKYFNEKANEYHIAAAGSLLGVKLTHTKGFPVGKVNFLDLHPLGFFEFLDALGKKKLLEFLMQQNRFNPIPEPFHQDLLFLLKKYMFIGGMPEAIAEYIKTQDILSVRTIQNEILDAYALDFAKHAPKEQLMKISLIWESILPQLAKENKKFIFSALRQSARGREYETAIQWLVDAGLIDKSYHINTPKLPLAGFTDRNIFKLFVLDVGLLSAMSHLPAKIITSEEGLFSEFHGAFTENFIAQELKLQHYPLYYWTSKGKAEVDFIIEQEGALFPLEVKAGISRKKKSLLVYQEKYHPALLLRTSLMNLKKDGDIGNLPLYCMGQLGELLKNVPS